MTGAAVQSYSFTDEGFQAFLASRDEPDWVADPEPDWEFDDEEPATQTIAAPVGADPLVDIGTDEPPVDVAPAEAPVAATSGRVSREDGWRRITHEAEADEDDDEVEDEVDLAALVAQVDEAETDEGERP